MKLLSPASQVAKSFRFRKEKEKESKRRFSHSVSHHHPICTLQQAVYQLDKRRAQEQPQSTGLICYQKTFVKEEPTKELIILDGTTKQAIRHLVPPSPAPGDVDLDEAVLVQLDLDHAAAAAVAPAPAPAIRIRAVAVRVRVGVVPRQAHLLRPPPLGLELLLDHLQRAPLGRPRREQLGRLREDHGRQREQDLLRRPLLRLRRRPR
jgi:hypothetical protein